MAQIDSGSGAVLRRLARAPAVLWPSWPPVAHPVTQPHLTRALCRPFSPLFCVTIQGLRLRQTYEVHSGYCLRGTLLDSLGLCYAEGAAFHDFHHSVNKGNFGNQFTDWLFGTMDAYADMGLMDGYLRRLKQDEVRSTKEG